LAGWLVVSWYLQRWWRSNSDADRDRNQDGNRNQDANGDQRLHGYCDHALHPGRQRKLAADRQRDGKRRFERQSGSATHQRRLLELERSQRLQLDLASNRRHNQQHFHLYGDVYEFLRVYEHAGVHADRYRQRDADGH
jgi:hypothetical protein